MWYDKILETNFLPEFIIRFGIKAILKRSTNKEPKKLEEKQEHLMNFIEQLKNQPIAIHMDEANIQHYELPSDFFGIVLGKHLKYSCCYWENRKQ